MIRNRKRVLVINETLRDVDENDTRWDDSQNYRVVGVLPELKKAYSSISKKAPEILVLAIIKRDVEQIELLKKIRFQLPGVKFLILCDLVDEDVIVDIISVGVSGIVPLNEDWIGIQRALDEVYAGRSPLNNTTARILLDLLQVNIGSGLTRRQIEILKLMSLGKTYITIADKLHISPETAKTHVKNIYRKLNVNSKEEALSRAIEERLILFF